MINVVKSQPAPPCLLIEAQKNNGDYKCGDVQIRIRDDFFNKCYICGSKNPRPIDVEHFRPKSRFQNLTFEWNNLFYACSHCNGIKLDKIHYDDILDCTDSNQKVTDLIEFVFDPLKEDSPDFFPVNTNSIPVLQTVNLLEEVFEGKTVRQRIGAENLTDDLKSEMNIFYHFALEFLQPNIMPSRKRDIKELIIEHLKPHSAFTAFKVWVIKRNRKLFQEFSQYLPT